MNTKVVPQDERTTAVENASYRWAYLVLAFGLLGSVAYRGLLLQQQNWDLLGLVILSGAVTTLYQYQHRVLSWPWGVVAILTTVLAAVLAGLVALVH